MLWQTKQLSEVILPMESVDPSKEPDAPFAYVDVSSVNSESLSIETPSKMLGRDAPSRARRRIRAGDVVFATIRPTLKRIAVIPDELDGQVCSTGFFVLRAKPFIDARYLFYFLLTDGFMDAMARLQTGASYPAVNDAQVKSQTITFPPLPEQKRIVAILDEAFEGIRIATANAEQNLANARELFDAHLNTAFEVEMSAFVRQPLSKYVDIAHGFAFDGTDFERSSDENLPIVLTPGNYAEDATLVFTDKNTKRYRSAAPAEWLLERDDLTVVMTDLSSKMKILGKPAFVPRDDLLHNQRIGRVVFHSTTFDPRFVYYFLRTRRVLQRVRETATGTMVRHTAPKRILANEIPVVPFSVQEASVSRLDHLAEVTEQIKEHQRAKLAQLVLLKRSILSRAFSGQLTAARERAA